MRNDGRKVGRRTGRAHKTAPTSSSLSKIQAIRANQAVSSIFCTFVRQQTLIST